MFPDLTGTGAFIRRLGVDDDRDMYNYYNLIAEYKVLNLHKRFRPAGELYFNLNLIVSNAKTKLHQSTANYEKIRLVGKGEF